MVDVSAESVLTGLCGVLPVFPTAALVSLLFRRRAVKLKVSGLRAKTGRDEGQLKSLLPSVLRTSASED